VLKAESHKLFQLAKPPAHPFQAITADDIGCCWAIWFCGKDSGTAQNLEVL
jgi:hypothetical protein